MIFIPYNVCSICLPIHSSIKQKKIRQVPHEDFVCLNETCDTINAMKTKLAKSIEGDEIDRMYSEEGKLA